MNPYDRFDLDMTARLDLTGPGGVSRYLPVDHQVRHGRPPGGGTGEGVAPGHVEAGIAQEVRHQHDVGAGAGQGGERVTQDMRVRSGSSPAASYMPANTSLAPRTDSRPPRRLRNSAERSAPGHSYHSSSQTFTAVRR